MYGRGVRVPALTAASSLAFSAAGTTVVNWGRLIPLVSAIWRNVMPSAKFAWSSAHGHARRMALSIAALESGLSALLVPGERGGGVAGAPDPGAGPPATWTGQPGESYRAWAVDGLGVDGRVVGQGP